MIVLLLPEYDVKNLMNSLLKEDSFDFFDLRSITVQSFARLGADL